MKVELVLLGSRRIERGAVNFILRILSPPNLPENGWAGLYTTASLPGTFSLTKSSPSRKTICLAAFPFKRRLNDKGVSSSAELDQQALPAGHLQPFEKGWRKLYVFTTPPSAAAEREVFSLLTFFFY